MEPTDFKESNCVLDKPLSMTRDECEALNVFKGASANGVPVNISCWKFTKEDMEEIAKTGRLWITVFGKDMPPICPHTEHPFE